MTPGQSARIAEIEARERAATEGPWSLTQSPKDAEGWPTCQLVAAVAPRQAVYASPKGGIAVESNRQFIAASRADIPFLLALIRDLERENASLRELASPVHGHHPEPGDAE